MRASCTTILKNPFVILVCFAAATVLYLNYSMNRKTEDRTKYLLYWSPFFTQKWDYYMGFGFTPFSRCEYKNCFSTRNRSLLPLDQFDAVIFHPITFDKKNHGIPWIRSPTQRYIFVDLEAPVHRCADLKQYRSFFNWTITYRSDSDIVHRYGEIIEGRTKYTMPSEEFLKNKTRLAAWFVSNCTVTSKRDYLTKEIQKFILVDVFGKCGSMRCSRKESAGSLDPCYDLVEQKYKFYFSFENSYCKEYVTEKLYNVLQRDVVPVVYGAGDYNLMAPPKSVINVEDYQSVQELTDYLIYLDQHHEEYLKYFEWKKDYTVVTSVSWQQTACRICRKLHEPVWGSVYSDLRKWWWEKDGPVCKLRKQLPKIVNELLR